MASLSIHLHCSAGHAQIRDAIAHALGRATRVDAAIAFVTAAGVDLALQAIHITRTSLRLVVSVRWPTDIRAVATLATRWPGAVWIHLGGLAPHELGGDRYQLHSKALALELPGGAFMGFVGSHNWTFTALDGVNLEATVEVRCDTGDAFAQNLRAHVDACIAEAEPFDPSLIDEYLVIQRSLQPAGLPDSGDDGDGGFEHYPAVVIHAEDAETLAARPRLRLSLGPDESTADAFAYERHVDLYLYPPGTLIGPERPTAVPTLFTGDITMVNTKSDAHVRAREVDCAIVDLGAPRITSVTGFPDITSAAREVAIRLDTRGQRPPFVYHRAGGGNGGPLMRERVVFEAQCIPGLPQIDRAAARRYLKCPKFDGQELLRLVPASIRRDVSVTVPGVALYQEHPEFVLRDRFEQPARELRTWRRQFLNGSLHRDPSRRYLVREPATNGRRFVFVATHRSKK